MISIQWIGSVLMVIVLLVAQSARAAPSGPGGVAAGIVEEPLTLDFGGFQAHAEADYPAGAAGRLPTVVLIPGSGPEDLNADIVASPNGPVLSHNFLDIANYLAPRGYAVLRYNKRYVSGPGKIDYQAYYTKLTLQDMLADAGQVLAAAEADPHVDARRIFLYGWSEGSTVAAALAVQHPELAGLIVQGPVAESWKDLFRYQIVDVGLPYVRQFAPDGLVTTATLRAAEAGDGGLVAKGTVAYLSDYTQPPGKLAVSPFFDRNKDGTINLATEVVPNVDAFLDFLLSPQGPLAIYAPNRALPSVTEQAPKLHLPVLILQGGRDANVPPAGAATLAQALGANPDVALKRYPGLGHSLGPAASTIADNFQPIAAQPLADLAAWLAAESSRAASGVPQIPAQMPATGGGMAGRG